MLWSQKQASNTTHKQWECGNRQKAGHRCSTRSCLIPQHSRRWVAWFHLLLSSPSRSRATLRLEAQPPAPIPTTSPPIIWGSISRGLPVLIAFPLYSHPTDMQTEPKQCCSKKITKCFIHISIYTTEQHFTGYLLHSKRDINIRLQEHRYVQKKKSKILHNGAKIFYIASWSRSFGARGGCVFLKENSFFVCVS